jgi:hypothetical protein
MVYITLEGVLTKLVELLQDLHTGSTATIKAFGGKLEPFEIKGGVQQGCNIAPLLFNIFLDYVVKQALPHFQAASHRVGVSVKFNWQGQPFHVDLTSASELELISILLYANDMAILVNNDVALNHCI